MEIPFSSYPSSLCCSLWGWNWNIIFKLIEIRSSPWDIVWHMRGFGEIGGRENGRKFAQVSHCMSHWWGRCRGTTRYDLTCSNSEHDNDDAVKWFSLEALELRFLTQAPSHRFNSLLRYDLMHFHCFYNNHYMLMIMSPSLLTRGNRAHCSCWPDLNATAHRSGKRLASVTADRGITASLDGGAQWLIFHPNHGGKFIESDDEFIIFFLKTKPWGQLSGAKRGGRCFYF